MGHDNRQPVTTASMRRDHGRRASKARRERASRRKSSRPWCGRWENRSSLKVTSGFSRTGRCRWKKVLQNDVQQAAADHRSGRKRAGDPRLSADSRRSATSQVSGNLESATEPKTVTTRAAIVRPVVGVGVKPIRHRLIERHERAVGLQSSSAISAKIPNPSIITKSPIVRCNPKAPSGEKRRRRKWR